MYKIDYLRQNEFRWLLRQGQEHLTHYSASASVFSSNGIHQLELLFHLTPSRRTRAPFLSNGKRLTWEEARGEEINVLHKLRRSTKSRRLRDQLWLQKSQIQTIVARHLGLRSSSQCNIFSPNTWNRGQFNICVNVQVIDNYYQTSRIVFRCPMPHKFGVQEAPDAVDEKIRSEVANYGWVETNCPDVPIPRLIGFGLSNGEQVKSCQ